MQPQGQRLLDSERHAAAAGSLSGLPELQPSQLSLGPRQHRRWSPGRHLQHSCQCRHRRLRLYRPALPRHSQVGSGLQLQLAVAAWAEAEALICGCLMPSCFARAPSQLPLLSPLPLSAALALALMTVRHRKRRHPTRQRELVRSRYLRAQALAQAACAATAAARQRAAALPHGRTSRRRSERLQQQVPVRCRQQCLPP